VITIDRYRIDVAPVNRDHAARASGRRSPSSDVMMTAALVTRALVLPRPLVLPRLVMPFAATAPPRRRGQ
jgi:hypothetical protein